MKNRDYYYMNIAYELSKKGAGKTKSNPLVGCVIVKDGKIAGMGYHEKFGADHAEIAAMKNSSGDIKNSTMYVTLEPCCHYGKTPPCVNKIIKSGIRRVVIGMKDPNPIVSGKSVELLKNNGIEVETGVLEEKISKLNESYIYFITQKKPFVTLKAAASLDGKIACFTGDSKWISSEESRNFTRKLRGMNTGIMAGINTVIKDNPLLTCRTEGLDDPVRIIIDSALKIPLNSNVLKSEGGKTLIYTISSEKNEKFGILNNMQNTEVVRVSEKCSQVNLKDVIEDLGKRNISSVILEGGGTLNFSMLKENLVQKALFIISPKIIGGSDAITSVEGKGFCSMQEVINLKNTSYKLIENDVVIEGYL